MLLDGTFNKYGTFNKDDSEIRRHEFKELFHYDSIWNSFF